ncbi:hypothetical protein QUH73_13190 [Labilibaculum sp. K2S]|uniref:hypothetical protein n=1 Tax=Labilibaculum sp. K2S TaxID=3056386 RepID=UPI0025A42B48|nr:hypothetical protein [Labilibaculum sp. K2S]MDM8160776.1 hypothetical protein [Labilibaculum sp. K2S]
MIYNREELLPDAYKQYELPALFTAYSIDWEKQLLDLRLHVLCENLESTANNSVDQTLALKIFDMYDLIKHLLIGLETESTGKLQLVKEESISSKEVHYQTFDFACRVEKAIPEERFTKTSIKNS